MICNTGRQGQGRLGQVRQVGERAAQQWRARQDHLRGGGLVRSVCGLPEGHRQGAREARLEAHHRGDLRRGQDGDDEHDEGVQGRILYIMSYVLYHMSHHAANHIYHIM
jgi:hypothetical protein